MKHMHLSRAAIVVTVSGFLLAASGCKTVIRENIVSSINSGIGITVAENPKTELYEVKVGYIRSQFYSIPTGKTVENEKNSVVAREDKRSNRADLTPQVVSGIRMKSGIEHLIVGLEISENFAVGEAAVNSPAAVAMYVGAAEKDNARSAADAAQATAQEAAKLKAEKKRKVDKIVEYVAPDNRLDKDKLKALAARTKWEADVNSKADSLNADELKQLLDREWNSMVDDFYEKLSQNANKSPSQGV
jgi:hypothetical protein